MKKQVERLPAFDEKTGWVNAIVETPKGSLVKYSFDPRTGLFLFSKSMPKGMIFPFNFGFVPQTLAEDGDALDVLILNHEPMVQGCLIKVELLGVLKASQAEEGKSVRNDRLIGYAMGKEIPLHFQMPKIDDRLVAELKAFFVNYNKGYGKEFRTLGNAGPEAAVETVREGMKRFKRKSDA